MSPNAGTTSSHPDSPLKTPTTKNRKIFEDDDVAHSIITKLTVAINERADGLQAGIENLKESVEFVFAEVKDLKRKMDNAVTRVGKTERKLAEMENKVLELSRYKRRWNLRLFGLVVEEGEDVRKRVISICQKTAPDLKDKLPDVIDSVHRLGKAHQDKQRVRDVILQFSMRHYHDGVWKAAKHSTFLQENKLRFKEDFSPDDRARRNQLWPLVEKARKEGKIAYFVGARAFIERKEIHPPTECANC